MVLFSNAFRICEKKFKEEGYEGVGEIYQLEDEWIFFPKLTEREYGVLPIVYPKNGDTPFYFEWSPSFMQKLESAKQI